MTNHMEKHQIVWFKTEECIHTCSKSVPDFHQWTKESHESHVYASQLVSSHQVSQCTVKSLHNFCKQTACRQCKSQKLARNEIDFAKELLEENHAKSAVANKFQLHYAESKNVDATSKVSTDLLDSSKLLELWRVQECRLDRQRTKFDVCMRSRLLPGRHSDRIRGFDMPPNSQDIAAGTQILTKKTLLFSRTCSELRIQKQCCQKVCKLIVCCTSELVSTTHQQIAYTTAPGH